MRMPENSDNETDVLMDGTFGDDLSRRVDVTAVIRFLLIKHGNKKLVLRKPPNGPTYWYNCIFGDPCVGVTKTLKIKVSRPDGTFKVLKFTENLEVNIKLRARIQ